MRPGLGQHQHVPQIEGGQRVCRDCRMLLFGPEWGDKPHRGPEDYELRELLPCPLDLFLLEMYSRRMSSAPYYVIDVGERYSHEPPHTMNDSATDWWVTE